MNTQKQTSTTSGIHVIPISTTFSKSLQLGAALVLGIVILYGAGFEPAAHNAAHDMRHSQGFPCH